MLLAKSRTHGELTLERHLLDTEQAACTLFRPGTRWGRRWLEFFKIEEEADSFLRELRVACLFHDLGKANQDFQLAVTTAGKQSQLLRHEHISALVMSRTEVRDWMQRGGVDPDVCTAAVLSHHLKASEAEKSDPKCDSWCAGRTNANSVAVHFGDSGIRSILARIGAILGAPPPVLQSGLLDFPLSGEWLNALLSGSKAAKSLRRKLDTDPRRRRLVAVKVGLIVADSAASGLFRVGESIAKWIESVAHAPALVPHQIREAVIAPRLRHIGNGVEVPLHPFQARAAEIGRRGLLLAACGTGKTLAAWAWAERQAQASELGRVIFLYPTRGTATEGFRDYAAWAPEGEATLLHGTAGYELERMLENPPESGQRHDLDEQESRLFALGRWRRRYFSATADQFLAAMEHRYESLCLLPALADSAVIIDEVHSFDPSMFRSLIAFLREVDVPVLCMTATLPTERREQLEAAGLRVFPSNDEAVELADLAAKEKVPRYRIRRISNAHDALEVACKRWKESGQRVLWVVNQVGRAQELAARLSNALGHEVLCYHSRFKLADRQRAHELTINAFQQVERSSIAVTTQVCEMSLDLDADVLITEEAPVTSLVQRLGRSNRHLRRSRADVFVYPMPDGVIRPYKKSDLTGVEQFLSRIDGRDDVTQAELARAIEELGGNETLATGDSSLFGSGYYAVPRDFREIDEFSRPCVLSADVADFLQLRELGRPTDGLIVPVPRRWASDGRPQGLPPFLGIAESAQYSAALGFVGPDKEVV